jgi:hypothetical protein
VKVGQDGLDIKSTECVVVISKDLFCSLFVIHIGDKSNFAGYPRIEEEHDFTETDQLLYPAALCFDIHFSHDLWKMMFLEMLHWSDDFTNPRGPVVVCRQIDRTFG